MYLLASLVALGSAWEVPEDFPTYNRAEYNRNLEVYKDTELVDGGPYDTPGFSFLGAGYDLLEGNPLATDGLGDPGYRRNLFRWTYDEALTTTDGQYRIADKTESRTFSVCSNEMSEQVYNSAYSYQKLISTSFDIDVNIGIPGGSSVDFSFGIDVRNTRNHTDTKEEIYAHVSATCTRYQLSMFLFDQANVSTDFDRAVAQMPVDFDMDAYARLISAFGTHYVSQMKAGGRWGLQMSFKSDKYQALIDNYIDIHAGIKFVAGQSNGNIQANHTEDEKTTYLIAQSVASNKTFNTGGTYNADPTIWMDSVKKDPMPIHMSLVEIASLFNKWNLPDHDPVDLVAKQANMKKAVASYCEYQQNKTEGFDCMPQLPIPMPTPTPIGQNPVRRVCVQNSGGYLLWWRMDTPGGVGAKTDNFAAGQTECIDGTDVNAKRGDVLGCHAYAIAGHDVDCGKPWHQYDEHSTLQANYKCDGSTLSIQCNFDGISAIGAQGNGGRRRKSAMSERLVEMLASKNGLPDSFTL